MSSDKITMKNLDGQTAVVTSNEDDLPSQCTEIPDDWIALSHDSGLTIYYNEVGAVATLSQPFSVKLDEVKSAPIPVSALPLLKFGSNSKHPSTSFRQNSQSASESGVNGEVAQRGNQDEPGEGTSETDEKEEGELTSEEDDDSRQGSVSPPPPKRQCGNEIRGERSSECTPNAKDNSEQKVQSKDARNRLLNLKVLNPDELQ
ncbi:unnamed protein product [Hymenolepis diminuta]|uniref:WW domain-containing protein n=1 Tax=Hymenolepis diminuta TaxID=6216 RepID=A0A564YIQ1_HYMDI|nr:unnamed protein product [Hymenolepis diminuta]